jgi:hypothetical protein
MDYVAFPLSVVAFVWGAVILFLLLPMHPYNDNVGVRVQTTPVVSITAPHLDHNGLPYCHDGKFVKAVAQ